MSRVYLLLRNNQQQGPYSLEEILQLNLKPFDLVWVEGKTAAWQYPGEIAALKPFVPLTPQPETPYKPISTSAMEINFDKEPEKNPIPIKPEIQRSTAKKIFVSMPVNSFQPKEFREPEPIVQKFQEKISAEPVAFEHSAGQENDSSHSEIFKGRSINATEEDYRKWIYKDKAKKTNRLSLKDLSVAALMIAVIGTGIYLITKPSLITKPQEQISQSSQVTTFTPVKQNNPEVQTQSEQVSITEPVNNPEIDITSQPVNEKNALVKNRDRATHQKEERTKTVSPVLPAKTKEPGETVLLPEADPANREQKNVATEKTPEKKEKEKKSLGTTIKNIFGKNKSKKEDAAPKNETVVLEPPRPATNRQSTKRVEGVKSGEEKSSSPVVEEVSNSISDQVELSSNALDNWMMGVSGLKVTLRNRSNSIIQTAMVNVYYYDNQNKQLDRKMIYFNQVPAKGKMTLSAPDNKWADRVEIKLGTVTAKEDRYARD